MYSEIINLAFEIGRYMSEVEEQYEAFVEHRVEALNILEEKLRTNYLYKDAKNYLLTFIFIAKKSQLLFEYNLWRKERALASNSIAKELEKANTSISIQSNVIASQISDALEMFDISPKQIRSDYRNFIRCVDSIAAQVKETGSRYVSDAFILNTFNITPQQNTVR